MSNFIYKLINCLRDDKVPANEDKQFDDYLLQEYSLIAQAHFKTLETISTFFKHYLLIMSIPLTAIAYVFASVKKNEIEKTIGQFLPLGGIIIWIIAIVGLMVMLYVINLRMDVLLYARTVNSIRKYFYDSSSIDDLNAKLRMRTLPQTAFLPSYYESIYFLPVIFSFGLFNSVYFYLGVSFFSFNLPPVIFSWSFLPSAALFFLLHYLFYRYYADYREYQYLTSRVIGVDIDGVLNRHREQFCKILKEKTGRHINPDEITHIPVHESNLNISREDEKSVFNDPQYWADMPIEENSPANLRKLKRELFYKVLLFTNRPWPMTFDLDAQQKKAVEETWKRALEGNNSSSSNKIIDTLTNVWLAKHNFEYDQLVIEKKGEEPTKFLAHFIAKRNFHDRFSQSIRNSVKYFVEDDLEKAEKLAYICDVVFLIDHPYNKADRKLPGNIIRVHSWNEIYRHIRRFS